MDGGIREGERRQYDKGERRNKKNEQYRPFPVHTIF